MEMFKFEKSDITDYIRYDLETLKKFREPLNYVINNLIKNGNSIEIKSLDKEFDLNKIKEREGKNYHWSVFTYNNITLVVRRYGQHLTIFTRVIKGFHKHENTPKMVYGAFTLNTDLKNFGDKTNQMSDLYYDKPFTDLNAIIKDLLSLLQEKEGGVHWVWNSAVLKRENHVDIELIFSENNITSIDNFIFCMEELESIYIELFSEITMIQRLKELKTGEKLTDNYTIGKIITSVNNNYYHGVGIEFIEGENKSFKDVYCLTRYYFDVIFKDEVKIYNGELYVEGNSFKENEPVAYKNMDGITLYQKSLPIENFIPLKKY